MDRSVHVIRRESAKGREIVISDLHGSLNVFKRLLEKIDYPRENDRLILLGDLMEKGFQNLDLIHFIINLDQKYDVICLMGNCDFIAKNILFGYNLPFLKKVLLERKGSLIHEMIASLNLPPLSQTTDMDQLAWTLREHYLKEMIFINDFPHVLVTPKRIYAHAGVKDQPNFADDFRDVLTPHYFAMTDRIDTRDLVVGHMPVSEYRKDRMDCSPFYNPSNHVWSIDGGNVVKGVCGQLNALVFEGSEATSYFADLLDQVPVLKDWSMKTGHPFYITWDERKMDVLKREANVSLVHSPYLNRTFWIENAWLNDQDEANGYTNDHLSVLKGEKVGLVWKGPDYSMVKRNGRMGWVINSVLDFDHIEPQTTSTLMPNS